MRDDYRFSLAKKAVGIYINDGGHIMWVQKNKEVAEADPKLVAAIRAAYKAFHCVYFKKRAGVVTG